MGVLRLQVRRSMVRWRSRLLKIARIPQRGGPIFLPFTRHYPCNHDENKKSKRKEEVEKKKGKRAIETKRKRERERELVDELTRFTPLQTDHVSATQRRGAKTHPVLLGSLFLGPLRSPTAKIVDSL